MTNYEIPKPPGTYEEVPQPPTYEEYATGKPVQAMPMNYVQPAGQPQYDQSAIIGQVIEGLLSQRGLRFTPNYLGNDDGGDNWDGGGTPPVVPTPPAPPVPTPPTPPAPTVPTTPTAPTTPTTPTTPATPAPVLPPPPGYAWAIDPITGKKELVDLTPLDPTKPLGGWKWITDDPNNPTAGHWVFNPTPDVLDKPFEGVPAAVIPWLKTSLDAGGDLSMVPEGPVRAWLNYLFSMATAAGAQRPDTVPFGLGLPKFNPGVTTTPAGGPTNSPVPQAPGGTTVSEQAGPTAPMQDMIPGRPDSQYSGGQETIPRPPVVQPVAPNAGAPPMPTPTPPSNVDYARQILGGLGVDPDQVDFIMSRFSEMPLTGRPSKRPQFDITTVRRVEDAVRRKFEGRPFSEQEFERLVRRTMEIMEENHSGERNKGQRGDERGNRDNDRNNRNHDSRPQAPGRGSRNQAGA